MINPYQNYKKTSIETLTKGEQLVLLLDKAIQRLTLAKMKIEAKDYKTADHELGRTNDIFNYLIVCLDSKIEISKELNQMYSFINAEVIKASAKHDIAHIDNALPLVRELRDTWEEADKIARANR